MYVILHIVQYNNIMIIMTMIGVIIIIIIVLFFRFSRFNFSIFWFRLFIPEKNTNQCTYNLFFY